jgi:F0F1-type ATP synthase membrane subunit c/vacuolar-type H+-ATPase subunit K
MLILWFALLMSVVLYFVLTLLVVPAIDNGSANPPSSLLLVGITAVGFLLVIASLPVKQRFLQRSVENQDLGSVQMGMLIACAMCEVTALLGLLEHFTIAGRLYYLLFALAAGGMALHFPRRSHVEAASYKARAI